MTSSNQYLSQDSLFVKLPSIHEHSDVTLPQLVLTVRQASINQYEQLLDQTYYLIKHDDLELAEILKLWQIRLILHLFNNQLAFAKKEAINLNNALYLHENNNVVPPLPPPPPPPQGASSIAAGASSSSLSTSNSATSSNSNSVAPSPSLTPIYPLPKNNQSLIDYDLLVLLLRLKSLPNLNLINEVYKLNYQLRLKSSQDLKTKLINLSYDVMVVMIVTKNYLSLLNYAVNLREELRLLQSRDEFYDQYLSNITALLVIVETIILTHKDKLAGEIPVTELITEKYSKIYKEEVNSFTRNSLIYTIQFIEPTVTVPITESSISPETTSFDKSDVKLQDIIDLVQKNSLTSRIICSTMGLWDLSNIFPNFKLREGPEHKLEFVNEKKAGVETEEELEEKSATELIDLVYSEVADNWYKYTYKIYGLE
ncbi:uncharacterized protein RJT20DRAFT_123763 [Scheffersomyces xylosifermentans]|uniref:uncharacterized protein n=1 Tax=Scheffersomyces xylosifermentans TaxID=1304137 RepID=UPI00315CDC01